MKRGWLLALALVVVGCGATHTPAPPATLPAGAIAGLTSRARALSTSILAAESLDHGRLARLLEQSRYAAGTEREFYGRARPFDHVVARTLRFGNATGARRYLAWVGRHRVDTLGPVRSSHALTLGDGGDVVRAKGCGCHGETPTYLAAWRHGLRVYWLLASGPGADVGSVTALARALDRLVQPA